MIYSYIFIGISFLSLVLAISLMYKEIINIDRRIGIASTPSYKELTEAKEDIRKLRGEIFDKDRKIKKLKLALEIKIMNDELEKGEY